jgi:transglutaminase-like putative cysteine protease
MSEVNGAIIAINNLTATRHSFATVVTGNSLALRVVMQFISPTASLAMDDVKLTASFDEITTTTTTITPAGTAPAQASRSSSSDTNTGVRLFRS